MKYVKLLAITLLALVIHGCSSKEDLEMEGPIDPVGMQCVTMKLKSSRPAFGDSQTGSVVEWQDGEKIYLLFTNGTNKVSGNAVYSQKDNSWTVNYDAPIVRDAETKVEAYYFDTPVSATYTNVVLSGTTGIYYASDGTYIYPTGGDLAVSLDLKPITGRIRFKGTEGTSISVRGIKSYTGYDVNTGSLTESVEGVGVKVQLDGYTPYIYATFIDESECNLIVKNGDVKFITECTSSVLQIGKSGWMSIPTEQSHNGWTRMIAVTGISLDKTFIELDKGATYTLKASIVPANATEQRVVWTSSDAKVASVTDAGVVTAKSTGTATITVTSVDNDNVKVTCTVTISNFYNGYEYVDLGLPSGLLWAKCNVGAASETAYGDYYAWGETTTKSTYTSSNYTYTGNPTTLPLDRDVAHVKWGGNWRMPTSSEIDELISNCTTTWTTIGGVNGYKVTGPNGNYIFLPAAGSYNFGSSAGSYGYYRSSSSSLFDTTAAYLLFFNSDDFYKGSLYRYQGFSVRPVFSE